MVQTYSISIITLAYHWELAIRPLHSDIPRTYRINCTSNHYYNIRSTSLNSESFYICSPSSPILGLYLSRGTPSMDSSLRMPWGFWWMPRVLRVAVTQSFTYYHNPCNYSPPHRILVPGNTHSTSWGSVISYSYILLSWVSSTETRGSTFWLTLQDTSRVYVFVGFEFFTLFMQHARFTFCLHS